VGALVAGPAARYGRVSVAAGGRTAVVDGARVARLVPLVIARDLGQPAALGQFGLDRPRATLTFESIGAAPIAVEVGGPNFDGAGVYMHRTDDPRVFLVLATGVAPVLALVGV
ncbi:MAG: DUF4340 domain-containing protein, partial [Acidimicrobiales bacterium]